MLFPVLSNPGAQGGVTQPVFPSDLSDRLLALYDQPRRLFTKLRGILPILLGHSDRSFPERNLLVPQSGKWEARQWAALSSAGSRVGRCRCCCASATVARVTPHQVEVDAAGLPPL